MRGDGGGCSEMMGMGGEGGVVGKGKGGPEGEGVHLGQKRVDDGSRREECGRGE